MTLLLRLCLITAAIVAVGGCVAKPQQPESAPAASTPPASMPTVATPKALRPTASTPTVPTPAAPSPTASTPAVPTPTATRPTAPGGGSSGAAANSTAAAGSSVPPAPARTADERRAALDERLNDSLGSFDAKLRKEQEKIAQERDARQATAAIVAVSDSSDKPGTEQPTEHAGTATTEVPQKPVGSHPGRAAKRGESGAVRAGDLKSERHAGGGENASGNGAVASEIPDGNDDNVVARRLRKAAEQETDPELRDKLWKEYVEYKNNAARK